MHLNVLYADVFSGRHFQDRIYWQDKSKQGFSYLSEVLGRCQTCNIILEQQKHQTLLSAEVQIRFHSLKLFVCPKKLFNVYYRHLSLLIKSHLTMLLGSVVVLDSRPRCCGFEPKPLPVSLHFVLEQDTLILA